MTERNFEKLEVGKWYVTRSGNCVYKIMRCSDNPIDSKFPFMSENYNAWKETGEFSKEGHGHCQDLVTLIEPPSLIKKKFERKEK